MEMELRKLANRKAQMDLKNLVPVTLVIAVVGLLIGAGSIVLSKFSDTLQTTTSYAVANETTNGTVGSSLDGIQFNASVYTFAAVSNRTFKSLSVTTVKNATNAAVVGAGNYTVDATAGTIKAGPGTEYNNTNVTIAYSYVLNDNSDPYQTTKNGSKSLGEVASFMPTIAAIIAAIIIIGIVVSIGIRKQGTFGI